MEGWREAWRGRGAGAATCTDRALGMRRDRSLRASLAAVFCASLLSSLMVVVAGRDNHFMRDPVSLSGSQRGTALEGQHRDREPQKKPEEKTHGRNMVPQIKRVHQGTAFRTSEQ